MTNADGEGSAFVENWTSAHRHTYGCVHGLPIWPNDRRFARQEPRRRRLVSRCCVSPLLCPWVLSSVSAMLRLWPTSWCSNDGGSKSSQALYPKHRWSLDASLACLTILIQVLLDSQGKGSLDSAVLLVRLFRYSESVPGCSNVQSVSRVNSGVDCWQFNSRVDRWDCKVILWVNIWGCDHWIVKMNDWMYRLLQNDHVMFAKEFVILSFQRRFAHVCS